MKPPRQKAESNLKSGIFFHFSIERIHIKVKFPCRLYLEYLNSGETKTSQEIRIDQKCSIYKIDEHISWDECSRVASDEESLIIYVKLLSNKGLAFTAGIINISAKDCLAFKESFQLKLSKSLDFDAYCECRRLQTTMPQQRKSETELYTDRFKINPSNIRKKESNSNSEQEKSKVLRELSSLKKENEKQQSSKSILSAYVSKVSEKKIRRTESIEDFRMRQKDLSQKIDDLQSEIHKNNVLFEKQKEIIGLLQSKQRQWNQEKIQFKTQIKALEIQIDEKRQKVRELEGQKLKLLMNSLQSQKEIVTLKQKIGTLLDKVYEKIKRFCDEKGRKIVKDYADKSEVKQKFEDDFQTSFSKIVKSNRNVKNIDKFMKQAKEGEEVSKVAFSAVRGLMNRQVDQAWLESSLGGPDHNPSSLLSNTFNDMSISDINGKAKQVSLLNSQLFLKPTESQQFIRSPSKNKEFIEEISKSLNKLQKMVKVKVQKIVESIAEIIYRNKANIKDGQSGQESLLSYLQQLQSGFQKQLGVLGQKDRVIAYYQQLIQQLNLTLSEKQNLVVQLEEQLFKLEEQKDQIKSQLHDANYNHSLKQEELLKKIHSLEYGQTMPDYSSSNPNKQQNRRRDLKMTSTAYQQEIIQCKEHMRMMQIDLLHEREERQRIKHSLHAKELELQQALIEKRRLQFAIKLKERMASLNQSIQFQEEEQEQQPPKNQDKFTRESLENEQYQVNIIIQNE